MTAHGGHMTAHGGHMTAHGGHMTAHGGHMTAYGGHMTALMVLWYVKCCALDCREAQTSNCGRNIPKCVLQTSYSMRRYYMYTHTRACTHTRTHTHGAEHVVRMECGCCRSGPLWRLSCLLPSSLLLLLQSRLQLSRPAPPCACLSCCSCRRHPLLSGLHHSFIVFSPPHTHPRSPLLQVWKGDMWSNLIYLRGSKTVRDMFTMKVEAIKKCVM